MGRPHLLVIPIPAQGHVMPMMELSHKLVDHGFNITFVNTEATLKRVVAALSNTGHYEERIRLVSIPGGMKDGEDPNNHEKFLEGVSKVMPGHFENLLKKMNESNDGNDRIDCVIADVYVGWALEIAEKMWIPRAAFWPASAILLAISLHIPKLIEDGVLTAEGHVVEQQMIKLCPSMPAFNTDHFAWLCLGDPALLKAIFDMMVFNNRTIKLADYLLCNSFYELEPSAFTLIPNLMPIGPLIASSRLAHFWPQDSTCLHWLDKQPVNSVIYVAFGSTAILDKQQFDELALGLELSDQRFLWVVRPDLGQESTDIYPDGFQARVGSRGQMVRWAPQREVLAHPAVGGFLTHCGWNSTMEGLSNGVPLLCWPYFSDQIQNKNYICDVWNNGLALSSDANGLISREEIKTKVVELLGNEGIKASALKWKESAMDNVGNNGLSSKNFEDFVQWLKGFNKT